MTRGEAYVDPVHPTESGRDDIVELNLGLLQAPGKTLQSGVGPIKC